MEVAAAQAISTARLCRALLARALARESVQVLGLLALVTWVAYFLHFRQFGLYEDDYFFVGEVIGNDPSFLIQRLGYYASWPQGRPIGFLLPNLLSVVGYKLGGMHALYLLGFAIVLLNSFLFYILLRRRFSRTVALSGALSFCLFPADTTKILLTHAFQLQPSLTFLLLASICYLNGRRLLAYLLIVGSLLSYESTFVVFFGIPLLGARWTRELWGPFARHAAILIGILGCGVLVRLLIGEQRAADATGGVVQIVPRVLGSIVIGPVRSLLLFFYGPLRVAPFPTWSPENLVLATLAGLGLVWVFRRHRDSAAAVHLLLSGLVLLVLAYGLAFTHYPPVAMYGRVTSVHLAATVGGSIIFASLASWALSRRLGPIVVGVYLGLLVGYSLTIQRDFARSWQLQQAFWTDITRCCSDLADGTILIFETDQSSETKFIETHSWADALVLREIYQFPETWQNPPRLFTLDSNWVQRIERDGAGWRWLVPRATWDEHWEPLPAANLIVLRQVEGRLVRTTGALDLPGGSVPLKTPTVPAIIWPRRPLFEDLISGA